LRTQNPIADSAVRRNTAAIGLREVETYSGINHDFVGQALRLPTSISATDALALQCPSGKMFVKKPSSIRDERTNSVVRPYLTGGGSRKRSVETLGYCHDRFDSRSGLRQRIHHLLGQLRAGAAVFVFEVNERVFPVRSLVSDKLRPAFDVLLLIIFAPEPEVTVVSGDFLRRREIIGVGDAQGNVSRFEKIEDFVVEPGIMAKLEREGMNSKHRCPS